MPKKVKVKNHLSVEEIQEKLSTTTGFWRVRRWMIILHAISDPAPSEDIAKRLGVKKQTVSNLISAYNRQGVFAIETTGKGQRQKAYLTLEEEEQFLKSFIKKAEKGEIISIEEIYAAYNKQIGVKANKTTVYRLLQRHGWRKISPRTKHPKSDKSKQETFKKTLPVE